MDPNYWTHNTAYHHWIIRQTENAARVLDVGCGDGLLVQKLAASCSFVVGLEPHPLSAQAAKRRLEGTPNAAVYTNTFEAFDARPGTFDAIIFAASLHHMEQGPAIQKAKELLSPGGKLIVVGCAVPSGIADWLAEGLRVIPARLGSWLHGETHGGDIGVPLRQAQLSLTQIRAMARKELPNAKIRRGLYYRYLLSWCKGPIQ